MSGLFGAARISHPRTLKYERNVARTVGEKCFVRGLPTLRRVCAVDESVEWVGVVSLNATNCKWHMDSRGEEWRHVQLRSPTSPKGVSGCSPSPYTGRSCPKVVQDTKDDEESKSVMEGGVMDESETRRGWEKRTDQL